MSLKRLFFYSNINRKDTSVGITKKVSSQIRVFEKSGYQVTYTSYLNDGIEIIENNEVVYSKRTKMPSKLFRFLRRYYLLHQVFLYLKQNDKYNVAYLRYHFFDRLFLKVLKLFKKYGTIVVVEAHGWPTKGKITLKSVVPYTLDSLYEKECARHIDFVAAISSVKNIWGCTTLQMDNGIDCNSISIQEKVTKDEDITIISVSNEFEYHGYPKIIESLYNYKNSGGTRNIKIVFVGAFLDSTQKLVVKLDLQQEIVFVGKKSGKELEDLYNQADLGIGALSARSGVVHGSSIKTKEYFAKGLPFITAWKEYSIPENYPYVLYLDPFENIVDMNQIIEFYDGIKNDKDMSSNMRKFAEDNYTWEKQLGKIISVIENNEGTE